jgi:hypothetical protein
VNPARRSSADSAFVRALAALGLTAVLIVPLMVPMRFARAAARSRQEIAEGLTCQCGCGLAVANCNHPNRSFSVPMAVLIHSVARASAPNSSRTERRSNLPAMD